MKKTPLLPLFLLAFLLMSSMAFQNSQTTQEPWSQKQLMPADELAKMIETGSNPKLKIFNIGPAGLIQGAIDIGEGRDKENQARFKAALDSLPKDTPIVIYCGCCPFKDCPNIRPTFAMLNELKFTQHKLLDLQQNLRVDWIDKGYP